MRLFLDVLVKSSWKRFKGADDYATGARKQKELAIYGLRHARERFFAHILTSKLALFDVKTKALSQKTEAEGTFENFTKSKVPTLFMRNHGK